ncbi:MAG: GatB/YqeY domain-containing protein [Candidatus Limnocylindria bacterium]
MTLQETIEQAVRDAMRAGDSVRTSTLRMVLAAAQNRRIEVGRALDDAEMTQVVAKQAKQRRESIEHFRAAGRIELAEKEESELAVLGEFLPQQLTPSELERMARDAVAASGASTPAELGRVMALLAPQVKGRADGREVSEIVRRLLAGDAADAGPGPVPTSSDASPPPAPTGTARETG